MKTILYFCILAFCCLSLNAKPLYFAVSDTSKDIEVRIDGKSLLPQVEYSFEKDMTYRFQVFGLKPDSEVEVAIKKGALKLKKEVYKVNKTGTVDRLFDSPNAKMEADCIVSYFTASNEQKTVSFRVKFY